jgi:hypothetical protein
MPAFRATVSVEYLKQIVLTATLTDRDNPAVLSLPGPPDCASLCGLLSRHF